MSFLPDELKPQSIKCEYCQQYISSELNVCKFCSKGVSAEYKQSAIEGERQEKKDIALSSQKNTIFIGCGLLAFGLFTLIQPIIAINYGGDSNYSCLTPIGIIGGVVILAKGLMGYFKEKKK